MSHCPICNQLGIYQCSACKNVTYCSKDHQKEDWKIHKLNCSPFEVKRNEALGRYITANRDLEANNTIIHEPPIVFGPKIMEPNPQCLGCYKFLDPDSSASCPKCQWPACSPTCPGLTDKQHHLPECLILSLGNVAASQNFMFEAITPLRTLLLQKKNPKKWKNIMDMESHITKRGKGTDCYDEIELIAEYLNDNFLGKVEKNVIDLSIELIHTICGIIEVNCIDIQLERGEICALYANACIMEHSCIPNTRYTIQLDDYSISIYSTVDLKKGDHIATMYTHMLWGTCARQEHLKNTKYFTCYCKRCKDPTELGTNLSSLKCVGTTEENKPCLGTVLQDQDNDWKCSQCPLILTSDHVDDLMSRISAEVDRALENPSITSLQQIMGKLNKLLHKNHYHSFMIKHSLIQLYGRERGSEHEKLTQELLQQKIDMCQNLMDIISILDPENSRVVLYSAVILLELSLALFEKQRRLNDPVEKNNILQQALDNLENCIFILRFDPPNTPGSTMANVVRGHIINFRKELLKYNVIELYLICNYHPRNYFVLRKLETVICVTVVG